MVQSYSSYTAERDYHLNVGDGYQLHIQEFGEPDGLPLLICHGGPGAGLQSETCRFFDLSRYRVIMFSQRGCGDSTPHSCTANSTACLIADIEQIRAHLDIKSWVVSGDSWGATLALLYSIHYPEYVAGLILRGTFLATETDFQWLYSTHGAGAHFYPETFAQLNPQGLNWQELLNFYQQKLSSNDQLKACKYAKLWCQWEYTLSHDQHAADWALTDNHSGINQATLMVHYFVNRCFISEHFITKNLHNLAQIPVWLIHGRNDLVCRYSQVQSLAATLNAQLYTLDGVGHSANNQVYSAAMQRAADLMYIKLSRH